MPPMNCLIYFKRTPPQSEYGTGEVANVEEHRQKSPYAPTRTTAFREKTTG